MWTKVSDGRPSSSSKHSNRNLNGRTSLQRRCSVKIRRAKRGRSNSRSARWNRKGSQASTIGQKSSRTYRASGRASLKICSATTQNGCKTFGTKCNKIRFQNGATTNSPTRTHTSVKVVCKRKRWNWQRRAYSPKLPSPLRRGCVKIRATAKRGTIWDASKRKMTMTSKPSRRCQKRTRRTRKIQMFYSPSL